MKTINLLLFCLILISSCDKDPIDCPAPTDIIKDSVYYINEVFEMGIDEKPFIIDTTRQIVQGDSVGYPKYRIDSIFLTSDERCPIYACSFCTGGFVNFNANIKNTYSDLSANDTLEYPSCTNNYLSGIGNSYPPIYIDSLELRLVRVLPQPGSDSSHITIGYIPLNEYKVSFRLQNQ